MPRKEKCAGKAKNVCTHIHTHVSDETSRKKIKKGKISILSLQIFCNIAFFLIKHINLCSPNHFKHTHTHTLLYCNLMKSENFISILWCVHIQQMEPKLNKDDDDDDDYEKKKWKTYHF